MMHLYVVRQGNLNQRLSICLRLTEIKKGGSKFRPFYQTYDFLVSAVKKRQL